MARGAEARAAMVAGTGLRLAEAGVPNRPRHADISRSDLSQYLHPDPRRAEEGADGAFAYCAADDGCDRHGRVTWQSTSDGGNYWLHSAARPRGRWWRGGSGLLSPYLPG